MTIRESAWFLGTAVALVCGSVAAQDSTPPEISDRFTVQHSPVPVSAVRNDDTRSGYPIHVWQYRTEVHNDQPFPLRIVRFGNEIFRDGSWVNADRGGRPFTSENFTEWYTAGAPVVDGWIAPGQVAADSTNWNRSSQPVPPQIRWYYVAADSTGREYLATAMPELCPYRPQDAPWTTLPTAEHVPVALRVEWPGGPPPAASQLRFERMTPDPLLPPPAVYAWTGSDVPAIEAAAPGLYMVRFQATGCHPWSLPIILADDDAGLALTLRPALRGDECPVDEQRVDVDAAHAYLKEVWRLQRRSDDVRNAYLEAYRAYEAAHAGVEGFTYDWSALVGELNGAMNAAPHEAIRRFAAWLACSSAQIADTETADWVATLLPAASPLWAAGPDLAVRAAFDCGRLLGRDLIAPLAAENQDHHVQAYALVSLAMAARNDGDEEAVAGYRARLENEFADVTSLAPQLSRISSEAKVLAGRPAPSFRVRDLDTGGELTNDDFAGHYLLVHFWATWCGFCKQEMPATHEAVARYRERGLEIVSFSLDRKVEDVSAYRQGAWKLPWKQAFLSGGQEDAVARAFEVAGIPRLVLIGPDGIIVAVGDALRGEKLDATLAKWLGQD